MQCRGHESIHSSCVCNVHWITNRMIPKAKITAITVEMSLDSIVHGAADVVASPLPFNSTRMNFHYKLKSDKMESFCVLFYRCVCVCAMHAVGVMVKPLCFSEQAPKQLKWINYLFIRFDAVIKFHCSNVWWRKFFCRSKFRIQKRWKTNEKKNTNTHKTWAYTLIGRKWGFCFLFQCFFFHLLFAILVQKRCVAAK